MLAASWLFGLGYFYPAEYGAWMASIIAAVLLMGRDSDARAAWSFEGLALALLLPAAWFAPWPYRAAPLLLAGGLALRLLPVRGRWINWAAHGALATGVVLFVQALCLEIYVFHTAGSHDLPRPLPEALAGIAALLGIDAAADGPSVVLHSMRQTHRLAAVWELLLDPATLLFFVGALAALPMAGGRAAAGGRGFIEGWSAWISGLRILTAVVLVWLPVRAGLLIALYMQRVLPADPDRPLHAMNHIFSPWMLLLLLIAPVLLAWRFVRPSIPSQPSRSPAAAAGKQTTEVNINFRRLLASAGLIALAAAIFTAAVYWNPPGRRKDGRVCVVERHSEWEPTTKPYDTEWFVEPKLFDEGSGYNYGRIYRYLEQFYDMSRLLEDGRIDDATLAEYDVLIIKTPTVRYQSAEVEAVRRFVERGGGLLLIGEHTNFGRSSTIINDIIRPLGFVYRDDLVLSFNESPYEQSYYAPTVPHPIVGRIPAMDYAGSCSIDPGTSRGRPFFACTGLWNMGPEYHHGNYFPFPRHCPEMRYGPFVQGWATRHGQGRIVAFTDSTIFSNFCVGQPGKSELMLGMVEWLNRAAPRLDPRPWLIWFGMAPLVVGVWLARASARWWLVLLAAGSCGWAVGASAVNAAHDWAMPTPPRVRPECRVVVDRTISDVPLAEGLYPRGNDAGYGMFEAWLSRMNCQSERRAGKEAFDGDVLVVISPSRQVADQFRRAAEEFVAAGGRLLVIDSPKNSASTANGLLRPFGLQINHGRTAQGKLISSIGLPGVDVERACEVAGGEPLARLDTLPVASIARHGKGAVVAVGFGSLWNDTRMGDNWQIEPDAATKARYEVMFGLLGPFFHGEEHPVKESTTPRQNDVKIPPVLKEAGPAKL